MRRIVCHAVVLLIATLAMTTAALRRPQGVKVSTRAMGAIQPRISPDGESIAFSYQGAIWRISRRSGAMSRLTSRPGFDSNPAWTLDGRRIAYWGGRDLRVIDAETGAPIPQSTSVQSSGELYFHPDGKRVLGSFGDTPGLSWLNIETGEMKQILRTERRIRVFGLSPKGTHIAYVTTQEVEGEQDGNDGPQADIWIVPFNGGDPARLVQFRSRVFDLWWGHQGLTIASDLGGAHNDLWAIDIDNPTREHRLTSGQADEDGASSSADGRWLVYTDNREGPTSLISRDLQTGAEQTLSVAEMDFGVPTGTLALHVLDAATGTPLTARVSVQQRDGKSFAPVGALYRILDNTEHFYAAGEAKLTVPSGHYVIRAFRGIEFLDAQVEVDVTPYQTTTTRVALKRWTDPSARGWWGGESHIHANYGYGQWYNTPATMRLQIEGEGLNVANMVVANSDGDGIFDREFFRGSPDPVSTPQHVLYWNEEFRATLWGHMTLFNLKHLVEPIMTGFKDSTNPWDIPTNADIADQVHLQGGHVNYTHPLPNARDPFMAAYSAKALPVDVALGKIDSLDVNGAYDTTVPIWYRLLNCGFRLPASAGTDVFLNRIRSRLPGGSRAYVRVDGPFSYDTWVKGLKAGRSFVTDGPMLKFTANGKTLGETIVLAGPGAVAVQAEVEATAPVSRLEIVHNGTVVANGLLDQQARQGSLKETVNVTRSGWLGLRAFDRIGRQAHTSPIYVEVGGRRPTSAQDAIYFLAWIDQLEANFTSRNRIPSSERDAHVRRQLEAARRVYRKLAID